MQERAAQEQRTGKTPEASPCAPVGPPPDRAQYNFTDPARRIMKNSRDDGFSQHYNVQAAVDQDALLIVGMSLSNPAHDQGEVAPTRNTLPPALGTPVAAALDTGDFREPNVKLLQAAGIEAYIATGCADHNQSWQVYFAASDKAPAESARLREKRAYQFRTVAGKAV
jgi:hypothetical protein